MHKVRAFLRARAAIISKQLPHSIQSIVFGVPPCLTFWLFLGVGINQREEEPSIDACKYLLCNLWLSILHCRAPYSL